MNNHIKLVLFSLLVLSLGACKSDTKTTTAKNTPLAETKTKIARVKIPRINEDSAYAFVKKQVDFGPRVPGTKEHAACKSWLKSKFESYGADVIMQDFEATIYTGEVMASTNIIAQFNPANPDRIILSAHWDSRMMGENDKDASKKDKPIDGADDGASGVGVLLELARIMNKNTIHMGVDIILWDAEDQGSREANTTNSWCKGSQYWSRNIHRSDYRPLYGILLDMVGAKDAKFYKDEISRNFAPSLTNKIWSLAGKMNSGDIFVNLPGGSIIDDHYYVNTIANIPMVDIIHTSRTNKNGFGRHWHTHDDNMDVIDKTTLRKVTQVVAAVTYKTSDNSF